MLIKPTRANMPVYLSVRLRGNESRVHLYMYGSDGSPAYASAVGIDVKSDDSSIIDIVIVWKAFLGEC